MSGNNGGHITKLFVDEQIIKITNKIVETKQEIVSLEKKEERVSGGNLVDLADGEFNAPVIREQLRVERDLLANLKFALERFYSYPKEIRCKCGNRISLERLNAVPWAEECQDCIIAKKTVSIGNGLNSHYQPAHIY